MAILAPGVRGAACVSALLCCLHGPGAVALERGATDHQIKAAFLFNCVSFIDWPHEVVGSATQPAHLVVLGEDPFKDLLEQSAKAGSAKGRATVIHRLGDVSELQDCHILFISLSMRDRLDDVLAHVKGRPILTVSEIDDFCGRGGMISFRLEGNNVRLSVNTQAALDARLQISSRVLKLATIVKSDREGDE